MSRFLNLLNKFTTSKAVKTLFVLWLSFGLILGSVNLASAATTNPGTQLPNNPGTQLPTNPGPAAPAPEAPAPETGGGTPAPAAQPTPWPSTNVCPNPNPVVSGLSISGTTPGTQTISWGATSNAAYYKLRIDDMTADGWGFDGACRGGSATDACNDHYSSTFVNWNMIAGHTYHVWVHAVIDPNLCPESPANNQTWTIQGASAPAPTATPVPQGSPATVTACPGTPEQKSGVWAPGYETGHPLLPSQCSAGQYLYSNVSGGYLTTACLAVPSDNVKTASGCSYTAQVVAPTNAPTPTPTNVPGVTATPTPTAGPNPTATPTPAPAGGTNQTCQAGQVQVGVNAQGQIICQNISNTSNSSATGGSVTNNYYGPTPAAVAYVPARTAVAGVSYPVKELPKTGIPLAAWAFSGLLPMGGALKRRFGNNEDEKDETSARFMWQKREFLRG